MVKLQSLNLPVLHELPFEVLLIEHELERVVGLNSSEIDVPLHHVDNTHDQSWSLPKANQSIP